MKLDFMILRYLVDSQLYSSQVRFVFMVSCILARSINHHFSNAIVYLDS